MKLLSTFATVAVLLLIGSEVVPSQGWSWAFSKENKTSVQSDEEVLNAEEEKAVDEADRDYAENSNIKSSQEKLEGAPMGVDMDDKIKFEIGDDLQTNIDTISVLAPQNQTNFVEYDRAPAQSPFVDNAPHPTQSQGMDPRFVNRQPRQCADDQYLCTKATPTQEHVRCIPNNWKCNGVRDCENNDDEEGCGLNHHRPAPNGCVAGYQYQCYGSGIGGLPALCIDVDKKCNGVYDCTYGDDENQENCPTGATRREEEPSSAQSAQQPSSASQPPAYQQTRPAVHSAPTYYQQSEPHQMTHQSAHQSSPPPPPPQPAVNCPNEEHYNRLAWTDRCIRTCISRSSSSNGHHHGRA